MSAMRGRGGLTRYVAVHRGGGSRIPRSWPRTTRLTSWSATTSSPPARRWPPRPGPGASSPAGRFATIATSPRSTCGRRAAAGSAGSSAIPSTSPRAGSSPMTSSCRRREVLSSFERRFQDWLYTHGGRFVAIVLEPQPRAYHDVFAGLPILFEPGRAGSPPPRSSSSTRESRPGLAADRESWTCSERAATTRSREPVTGTPTSCSPRTGST